MKKSLAALSCVAVLACAGGAHAGEAPSVLVETATMTRQDLAVTLTGYGRVSPDIGSTVNINLPRPGQVARLLVSAGEVVKAGTALAQFDTGAAAALAYRRAQNALSMAREDLERTRQMAAQRLATQSQLAAARKAAADAEAALEAQRRLGAGRASERVRAPFDGIVVSVAAAQGDRLAAGATVLQLARETGLRVDLGIEPEDSDKVKVGMPVRLASVFDSRRTLQAKVAQVHGMVNPRTQLVDVVLLLHGGALIPGMRVRGVITLSQANTWTVPRSAVLRDARGAYIFQVKDGHALRVNVQTGTETDRRTGIRGDFDPALPVVVLGNYELEDGMAVREAARCSFVEWVQAHRRSILFFLLTLAAAGLVAAFKLPVTLFPNVDFPRVRVDLEAGDRPADLMALQVTIPVEEAVRRVPGVRDVRSRTSRGSAEVSVSFDWGTGMALATSQVNEAITQILPSLPPGTTLRTLRMDPTVFPILSYSLTSKTQSLTQLYDLARYQLLPLLSGVNGVARVGVTGGTREEYRVTVDPARLQAYGLALTDVARALSAANVVTAVGRLEDHYKLYLGVSDTRLKSLAQIRDTVLRTGANGIVRLSDVATVTDSTVPQWIRVTADGRDAVLLDIYQQPGGNSVRIAGDVKAKLAAYRSQLPAGVQVAKWYDQSQLVVASAASVRDAILIGAGLAALVLLAFLRNLKITLIAIIVLPTVLAATIVLLYALGMSFNIMTLGGMAAAVGLIIDDAIVMIEHIVRRLRGAPREHHGRVMAAALEFARPLAGSSASTIVIFVPLAFLSGVTGAFFKALSLTVAAGLAISFLVTWLAVPILADHLLGEKDANQKEGGPLTERLHRGYEAVMRRVLARPAWVLIGVVPLLAAGWLAYQHVGSGFMPRMDEGGFILDYVSPPGTSLTETDRLLRQVEGIIERNPYVATYSRRTGTQLGGGVTEANEGDFFIRLKSGPRPPIERVMDAIRTRVEQQVPGLKIELAQLMEDLIGDLTAVPQPIEVKIFSDDPAQLQALAREVEAAIGKVPGVVDTRSGIRPAGDALEIHVDRVKAALEGVDPEAVTQLLSGYLSGLVTTQVQSGPKMIGVRVWIPRDLRRTTRDVGALLLRAPDGHLFPLSRVARVVAVTGQPQITRDNLKRMVAVTGRISGRDLGSVIRDVKRVLARPGLIPRGVYYELGGLYKQQQIAFRGLAAVFAAAVALVFLLLLFLYESFRVALSILAIPLLAVSAVFIGLWATGIELNISAMMGMTMIVGIVTEVAIFYFSEYHDLAGTTDPRSALIEAGKNRMRPIAMTTFAAILTLLPLAFAIGQGSAMQQPLAVAIIAGLAVQLPLVLLVMPVLFHVLMRHRGA